MIQILGSWLLFLILFFCNVLYAGSVEARVDSDEVVRGKSLILTITAIGEEFDSLPDISTIGGATVLNLHRTYGSNYMTVNGKSRMEKNESLMIEFLPEHNMTIPVFQIEIDDKIESTEPIVIKLLTTAQELKLNPNFKIEMQLNKSKVYLEEPVVVTVHFSQKRVVDVMRLEYQQPEFNAFFSKLIGKERSYTEGKYTVHELKYLLIAKEEGNLTIEPARAKIAERIRDAKSGGWFSDIPQWSSISSKSSLLEVLKPNIEHDVVGDYNITDTIDTIEVKANKPVHLNIKLEGEGSLEDFKGIEFTLDGVTIYGDEPKRESRLVDEIIKSHYLQSFVFIAEHDFTIPSRTIKVYNHKSNRVTQLKTKAYQIRVLGGLKPTISPILQDEVGAKVRQYMIKWKIPEWSLLLGVFIFGMVVALLGRKCLPTVSFFKKELKGSKMNFSEALKTLYPHVADSKEIEAMVRQLYDLEQGKRSRIDKKVLNRLLDRYTKIDTIG